jgi:hypothetical protein
MTTRALAMFVLTLSTLLFAGGCRDEAKQPTNAKASGDAPGTTPKSSDPDEAKIQAVRAGLSPEDRKLVDAQEWCAVEKNNRLGSMNAPVKLTVNGQPVFLCCGGCREEAVKYPDATLKTVEELKAKKRNEMSSK